MVIKEDNHRIDHRMVWLERTFKDHLAPTPVFPLRDMRRVITGENAFLQHPDNEAWGCAEAFSISQARRSCRQNKGQGRETQKHETRVKNGFFYWNTVSFSTAAELVESILVDIISVGG